MSVPDKMKLSLLKETISNGNNYTVYEFHSENGAFLFAIYGPMAAVASEATLKSLERNEKISPLDIFERFPRSKEES